ncbi:hypothetical protein LCL95_03995 [Bacillus timonensis]|nr:hypothetical protein [Bacillus timonensis]
MSHIEDKELISLLLGEVSVDRETVILAHIIVCQQCKETYEHLSKFDDAWENHEHVSISSQFAENIDYTIKLSSQRKEIVVERKKKISTITHFILSAAATIFLINNGIFSEISIISSHAIDYVYNATNEISAISVKGISIFDAINIDLILTRIKS